MAEQERKTKAERREEKRQRRMEEEAAREAAARRGRMRNVSIAVALVAVLGGLGYLAVGNLETPIDEAITVSAAEVEEARAASECEVIEVEPIASREHLDPATAPPAEALYVNGRPTATGPHYENPGPIFSGVREGLDERATTHNMEHGSVIVWYDAEQLSSDDVDEIDSMVERLNEAGFSSNAGRAGILAGPFEPGIDSGSAVAIRSWGQGMDCGAWDIDYAYGWIAQNFGSRGPAPEAALGQYPENVLEISDEEGGANVDEDATDEDATDDGATEEATAGDEPTATESTSDEPTATDSTSDEG